MEHPALFAIYGVISVSLFWTLMNGGSGSLVGGNGQVTADEAGEGFSLSVLLRIVLLLFCLAGCAHAIGIIDDPIGLARKVLPSL